MTIRLFYTHCSSLGQFMIDCLASKFSIRLAADSSGFSGRRDVELGNGTEVALCLYKSSTSVLTLFGG